ncbi:MAG TPA: response regulator [Aggregatilineales bacterium]|nr:response regulator [Aggregatilineales bacterium]
MAYILLVEDNQASADIAIHTLQTSGYEVRHFTRGLDGAKVARKERPSLILMDFNLPDVDGRTLALLLKKQLGDMEAPPIVAFTARTGHSEEMLARSFGCEGFISKPFTPAGLLDLVNRLLQQHAAMSDANRPTPRDA